MKKRHYYAKHGYSKKTAYRKQGSGYFFIKVNICLGIIICTAAALSMENESVSAGCERLGEIIGTSLTPQDFKEEGLSLESFFTGKGTYTFAGEKENKAVLSDEIKAEIESRSNVYENNNKGAPQGN